MSPSTDCKRASLLREEKRTAPNMDSKSMSPSKVFVGVDATSGDDHVLTHKGLANTAHQEDVVPKRRLTKLITRIKGDPGIRIGTVDGNIRESLEGDTSILTGNVLDELVHGRVKGDGRGGSQSHWSTNVISGSKGLNGDSFLANNGEDLLRESRDTVGSINTYVAQSAIVVEIALEGSDSQIE